MLGSYKDLLINILFIVFPLFIYQIFVFDRLKSNRVKEIAILFVSAISIVTCMTFPIVIYSEYVFDLRHIPFILGSLYSSKKVSTVLFTILIVFRYVLGGSGFYGALLIHSIIFITVLLLIPIFKSLNSKNKILFPFFLSFLFTSMMVLGFLWLIRNNITAEIVLFCIQFILLQTIGVGFTSYLIETMVNNHRMRQEILFSEKFKVVSELSASISHEVRNPLTVTRGFVQMLREEIPKEKREQYTNLALQELDRAKNIITDYLTFAKPQPEEIHPLLVSKEVEYVIGVMTPYAMMQNVEIRKNDEDQDARIVGDPQKFRQCLVNIIKNGIEAMHDGGVLSISLLRDTSQVCIKIEDTGIGMSEEEVHRLGMPFFSSKAKGTGLGMMVCYSIIQSMSGEIRVKSKKGSGTCFFLHFPIKVI